MPRRGTAVTSPGYVPPMPSHHIPIAVRAPRPRRAPTRTARPAALALLAATALAACGRGGALRERLAPRAAHERYAAQLRDAGLDRTALGARWITAAEGAVRRPAAAPLPFRESGTFAAGDAGVAAWRVAPKRGQRVRVAVAARATDAGVPAPVGAPLPAPQAAPRLFLDVFRLAADDSLAAAPERVASADSAVGGALAVEFVAERDGEAFVVRLQPELLRGIAWTATAEVGPSLATFPVGGRTARSVQSFWGADRDGGARAHEGIDIFAPRGTPVVAATDGIVSRVGENRLGGLVVFLHDPSAGQSLYYAHLDSQLVASGQRVRAGDTLGLVGNTGNARTTAPHLHFGIYRRGEGALDPLPFVDDRVSAPPRLAARDSAAAGRRARTAGAATLRAGPGAARAALVRVPPTTPVTVESVSAVTGSGGDTWLRVRLADGTAGYLPTAAVRLGDATLGD